ncbi:MAG: hypothetical protein JWM02_720 [Frankiales bacterium]|nr:hypothetical protein [Frankiales bacterium]
MTAEDIRPAQDVLPDPTPRRRRRALRAVRLVVVGLLLLVGVSLGRALTGPGTDSVAARAAEWARSHGLSAVIDRIERVTYHPPAVGGTPAKNSPLSSAPPVVRPVGPVQHGLSPLVPIASPALPGEGTWRVISSVNQQPALQVAFLRPDAVHTSYTAGVAWMDPSLLRFVLHPGIQEPGGGGWPVPSAITAAERPTLVAAFNGGFRLDAARGGFVEGGRTARALRQGAASLVISSDGRATVGQWGRDVGPGPTVVAVRQNLDLLVDGGRVAPGLDVNTQGRWGATLGNALYVWRSGVGVTASGALVYVSGNRLSAATLAELLRRAGSVRAMELDINPEWTSFVTYPQPTNLLPDMQRSPRRYDTTSTRDFIAVLRRTP